VKFSQNLALAGAALMLMQLDELWEDEEMYVRLGGQDLRELPA